MVEKIAYAVHKVFVRSLPATSYVFVDFENVPEIDLSLIGQEGVHLTLFLGALQTKLSTAIVEKLLAHSDSVQFVRLGESGRNALDFTLAYYVGRAVVAHPGQFYGIVSKDADYDPLVRHLQSRAVAAYRFPDCASLLQAYAKGSGSRNLTGQMQKDAEMTPVSIKKKPETKVDVPSSGNKGEVVDLVIARLRKGSTRPKREKTLLTYLAAALQKPADSKEVKNCVQSLIGKGLLKIDDKKVVSFQLPPG